MKTGWDLTAKRCVALACAWILVGCASVGSNPRDPLERYNRAMFSFNDTVDRYFTKPVAEAYRAVLPGFVRTGVRNFLGNLEDVWIGANNFFQGKFEAGFSDLMRVSINSVIGLGGLFDVASEAGLEKNNEDFGQTLGRWGVGSGPYVVLPLLGPSTLRDSAALPVDFSANLLGPFAEAATTAHEVAVRNSLWGTNFVGRRADLLDASALVDQAALDRYAFIRDAYLQRRLSLVHDGKPPPPKDEDEDDPPAAKPPGRGAGTSPARCCLPLAASPGGAGPALTGAEGRAGLDPAGLQRRIEEEEAVVVAGAAAD